MRFMMLVKATTDSEAGLPPNPELMAAVGAHAEKALREGVLLDTGGLAPSGAGARIRLSGGKLTLIDGPFAEAKELVGGYAILEAGSREEAIEMGMEFMALHRDILDDSYEGELEIRQIFGPSDFPPAEAIGNEARLGQG